MRLPSIFRRHKAERDKNRVIDFWREDRLRNVVPPGSTQPEGWDPVDHLATWQYEKVYDRILDIGCGYGRLCTAFPPEKYLGIDINPEAVKEARLRHTDYEFREVCFDDPYPPADIGLAYTVLLHIGDRQIESVVARMCNAFEYALVAEILGRKWRIPGQQVPVFNRELHEYESFFSQHGMRLYRVDSKRYHHYPDTDISFLEFRQDLASSG